MPNVSVVEGVVRYDNVFKALELIRGDVEDKIGKSTHIMIKPDLLHIDGCSQLADVDAVRAVLDFVEDFTNKKITIAEGSFADEDVFHQHDFHELLRDYSVRFLDLNHDDSVPIKIGTRTFNVSKSMLESDFRISLPLLRLDRKAALLGSIPNVVIGSVLGKDKADFYAGRDFHRKTAELFRLLRPSLSVIDGFGAPKSSLAIASSDAVAADATAAKILKIKNVPYLDYCGKRKIRIIR